MTRLFFWRRGGAALETAVSGRRRRARRVLRGLAKITVALLLATGTLEGTLQLASLFAIDRSTPWRPGASRRILCVGDSHTYGGGVRAEESYPAQMQRILDAAAPGVYSIVNRGVPGFNSAQVRRRLPNWIAELQPDTVVVLVGTNNVWNLTDEDTGDGWHGQLYASILRLRTVRFVRVWLHQRSLDANLDWRQIPFGDRPRFSPLARNMAIDWGGDSEVVDVQSRPAHLDESAVQRARRDYEAIVRIARERRVGVVFITYGGPNALFQPFSDAMREVAMHERCPLVDAAAAVRRVPRNKVSWTFGMHPGPALLTEIARDVAAVVRAAGDGSAAGSPPAK